MYKRPCAIPSWRGLCNLWARSRRHTRRPIALMAVQQEEV